MKIDGPLGGQPVELWGYRCNNMLMSPAVTERLINNLDNLAEHGINLISVSLQGTNGGFPDADAGPKAFRSDGMIIPAFADRLERLIREADERGMVVPVVVLQPCKDQTVKGEMGVRRAIEETGRLLTGHGLKNVMVNLYQEFDHSLRVDHEVFREPDGAANKAEVTGWFKAEAPDIEAGICPNYKSGSSPDYPGVDVRFFHESMPAPESGFAVNTEAEAFDSYGDEGIFNEHSKALMAEIWSSYLGEPRTAMLLQSPYVEGISGATLTGPNPEMGGDGTGVKDRGVRFFFDWMREHVGRWEYPAHVPPTGSS
ncbi:hypothetical protein [Tautonia plasticadhaerens]|uniref:Uncharacterized protein n=1 Tax=Tautonia plasticadhaerens TaxID=2527974 RepID=A0A518HF75_9BACT|nr:hypothetical protein [Tautonia plasticadhaerens]QDV39505.1 hypothetical protein ElP_74730 [Tautonia plasticadhaerens]